MSFTTEGPTTSSVAGKITLALVGLYVLVTPGVVIWTAANGSLSDLAIPVVLGGVIAVGLLVANAVANADEIERQRRQNGHTSRPALLGLLSVSVVGLLLLVGCGPVSGFTADDGCAAGLHPYTAGGAFNMCATFSTGSTTITTGHLYDFDVHAGLVYSPDEAALTTWATANGWTVEGEAYEGAGVWSAFIDAEATFTLFEPAMFVATIDGDYASGGTSTIPEWAGALGLTAGHTAPTTTTEPTTTVDVTTTTEATTTTEPTSSTTTVPPTTIGPDMTNRELAEVIGAVTGPLVGLGIFACCVLMGILVRP